MSAPILKQTSDKVGATLILGGLHYIKGNPLPYFSLTVGRYGMERGEKVVKSQGRPSDEVLAQHPEFSNLEVMHLSDITGLPLHAVANGWYWLCGAVEGHHDARYHGGNSLPARDRDECLAIFCNHFRIGSEQGEELAATIRSQDELAAWVETQKPRYRAEAERAISEYGLVIYGDAYLPAAA
jgi:hypothetical protein